MKAVVKASRVGNQTEQVRREKKDVGISKRKKKGGKNELRRDEKSKFG